MLQIVSVKYGAPGTHGDFVASDVPLRIGDRCVVTTDRGVELGMVIETDPVDHSITGDMRHRKVLRRATERDLYLYEKKKDREESAFGLCRRRIAVRELPMKLSRVEYIFDGSRVIFYFTADGRIDFRQLVKDLARQLRTRIEMRQIGARDEAKLLGGMGCCGTGENCSSMFLSELKSVSVKTAKAQDLTINPGRLSGMCGRLKCCLNFESDMVREAKKRGRRDSN
ncbi:MAG TPA: regulatory iron-sulfur-containing complex subunit RicT [Acidobacteriota bacterium]|nr:regulatory iron-sulfur-containing complex subunit RicT [Acidobacteriota bacterium]